VTVFGQIVKSLLLTALVSAGVSIFLLSFSIPFLNSFLFFIVLQFIGFYFYGEHVKRKALKLEIDAEIKLLEESTKQQLTVVCPCDKNIQSTIPIDVNRENKYICQGCNKQISVFLEAKTALSTTPILTNPLDNLNTPLIDEEVKKLIKQK
jgi:hypothetical protein